MPFPRRDPPSNVSAESMQPQPPAPTQQDTLYQHRQARYLELGFSEASAAALAGAGDGRFPLWPGRAQALLENGATHEQVVQILG